MKNEAKIAKIATIIILIALVRTISEPFRLQYYSSLSLTFNQIKPFLIAALITSLGLFAMIIFYYYRKYKVIICLAVLIIIGMLIVKYVYL
ncbi:hypothetical protein I5M32_06235 [Pedobacter sp. SD-b]|uniref:Uncharacterized protein n=2 Tax=Pedobacter segetis TaxID=2793069 RepID=A0ABS1BJN0_9SPHI|nr:hypothetical protein [Pedobacter segetis]